MTNAECDYFSNILDFCSTSRNESERVFCKLVNIENASISRTTVSRESIKKFARL